MFVKCYLLTVKFTKVFVSQETVSGNYTPKLLTVSLNMKDIECVKL